MAGLNERDLGNWRRSFSSLSADERSELESHVDDLWEELLRDGAELSREEALLVALRRVGHPQALADEYAKIHSGYRWAQRLYWMCSGFVLLGALSSLVRETMYATVGRLSFIRDSDGLTAIYLLIGAACLILAVTALWLAVNRPDGLLARVAGSVAELLDSRPTIALAAAVAALGALAVVDSTATGLMWRYGIEDLFVVGVFLDNAARIDRVGSVVVPLLLLVTTRHLVARTRSAAGR